MKNTAHHIDEAIAALPFREDAGILGSPERRATSRVRELLRRAALAAQECEGVERRRPERSRRREGLSPF